jgi:hypothetical protein
MVPNTILFAFKCTKSFTIKLILNQQMILSKVVTHQGGVKCCVAAVKSCPVLHFSVVIFFWSFGFLDASTIKC